MQRVKQEEAEYANEKRRARDSDLEPDDLVLLKQRTSSHPRSAHFHISLARSTGTRLSYRHPKREEKCGRC